MARWRCPQGPPPRRTAREARLCPACRCGAGPRRAGPLGARPGPRSAGRATSPSLVLAAAGSTRLHRTR